jgi:O-antigen ligase
MRNVPTQFGVAADPHRAPAAGGRLGGRGFAARAARAQAPAGYDPPAMQWQWDLLRIALFALVLMSVSRIHQHISIVAVARPALLVAGIAFVYAFLNPHLLGTTWWRAWPAKVVAALGVVACLSAPFGLSLGASGTFILREYAKVLILTFLLMAVIRQTRDLAMFVWAYVISCGVLVWMALFVFDLTHFSDLARLNDLYTYDANDVGVVLLVGFGLALLTFQTSGTSGKVFSAVVLFGIGMAIARSGSRGSFLGLLVVGVVLLFFVGKVSIGKRVAIVATAVLALAIAAPAGYWQQMETVFNPTEDYNWADEGGRRMVFMRGLSYLADRPFTGVGIDNFGRAEGTLSARARAWVPGEAGVRWMAPHNSYLQAGVEMGIPGFILFSSLVFGGMVGMRRLRRRLPPEWEHGDPEGRFLYLSTVYLPVAYVGFAVTCFFVSFAYMDPIYILSAFSVGIYVCVQRRLGTVPGLARPASQRRNPAFAAGRRFGAVPPAPPAH